MQEDKGQCSSDVLSSLLEEERAIILRKDNRHESIVYLTKMSDLLLRHGSLPNFCYSRIYKNKENRNYYLKCMFSLEEMTSF